MKRLALIAVLVLSGCKSAEPVATAAPTGTPFVQSAEEYVRVYGGLAGAYRSILAETSCTTLQDDLYTATENNTLGYQAAIVDRAKAIGCPDLKFIRP